MKKFFPHPAPVLGIDQSKPAHLIPEGSARTLVNYTMRDGRLRELDGTKLNYTLTSGLASHNGNIVGIIPDKFFTGPNFFYAFSSGVAPRPLCVDIFSPSGFVDGAAWVWFFNFTGAGVAPFNTLTLAGNATALNSLSLGLVLVRIRAGGATFEVSINGGAYAGVNPISSSGTSVTFGAVTLVFQWLQDTGYTAGDVWSFGTSASSTGFNGAFAIDPYGGPLTRERVSFAEHSSGTYYTYLNGNLGINPAGNGLFRLRPGSNFFYALGTGTSLAPLTYPTARYIETFYEHLLIANLNDSMDASVSSANRYRPNRIRWSDVFDFSTFTPTITNEADLYDVETSSSATDDKLNLGITGLKRLRNRCMIYTQEDAYAMEYVGLPTVMQITRVVSGCGNFFRWGLGGNNNKHFYWSKNNCWSFDGTIPTPIGDRVAPLFFSLLDSSASNYQQNTFAVTDEVNSEVRWYFQSINNNVTNHAGADMAMVYNYKYDVWALWNVAHPVSQTGTVIEGLSAASPATRLFPEAQGFVNSIYATTQSPSAVNRASQTPVYETKDFAYGTDIKFDDVESCFLDASFATGGGVSGIDIWYAFRDSLHAPVQYRYAGTYTGAELQKLFSLPRRSGRVFRFLFGNPYNLPGALIDATQPVTPPYSTAGYSYGAQEVWGSGEDAVVERFAQPDKGAQL